MTDSLLRDGDYARKQLYCPSGVVRWSHGSRFDLARRLVARRAGGRLLDYGCGDGTFVAMVHDNFREVCGWDVDPGQVAACRTRLGRLPGTRFEVAPAAVAAPAPDARWDVVTCMEVLEHCLEPERRRVLDVLAALVRPGGLVVISVPIEIGPSVAAKQLFRALAGLRRLGDYRHRERYSPIEMLQSVLGMRVARIAFEGRSSSGPYQYYGHKGFDYRELAAEIAGRFTIREQLFSPMPWLGAALNSQIWFVCESLIPDR
ncbi:MAG TPA: class I SAM-dependent methyltransferase [Vicinamibacterales bacterium]|nr:class I SAM-dependent methyltransferase [Vicinamibacterales bacterium]